MEKTGLILEGGGMRGTYTAGVLDAFMEHNINFNYIIGVSAGANNASNYISKQKGRSKRLFLEWSQDKRFISFANFLRSRSYFGMDFLFNELPNHLDPFDYASFYNSDITFCTCLTNVNTGKADYYYHKQVCPLKYMNIIMRAGSSLPIISPKVTIGDYKYLDGFITDPIPINKSIADGNTKHVVILTKKDATTAKLSPFDKILKTISQLMYPNLKQAIENSATVYQNSLNQVESLQTSGQVYLFKPSIDLLKNRYTKDVTSLKSTYNQGYQDALNQIPQLKTWLS